MVVPVHQRHGGEGKADEGAGVAVEVKPQVVGPIDPEAGGFELSGVCRVSQLRVG